jgi:hypothetical protein
MIRLYNHCGLPDKPLRDCLTWAARRLGIQGDVCVKLTDNNTVKGRWSGLAHDFYPRLAYLLDKRRVNGRWTDRRKAPGSVGWIEIANAGAGTANAKPNWTLPTGS